MVLRLINWPIEGVRRYQDSAGWPGKEHFHPLIYRLAPLVSINNNGDLTGLFNINEIGSYKFTNIKKPL